mgnify:CR=1 FL=1
MEKQNLEQEIKEQEEEIRKIRKKVKRAWWIAVFNLWNK